MSHHTAMVLASESTTTTPQQGTLLLTETSDQVKEEKLVHNLDVSTGKAVKLDALGPLVVNSDGTLSRIDNWVQMTDAERERTLRVLSKRNRLRLAAQEEEDGGEHVSALSKEA